MKKGVTPDTMIWVAETHRGESYSILLGADKAQRSRHKSSEEPVVNRLVQAALAEKLKSEQSISVNGEWPTMTLGNAIKVYFTKYFVFSGRSRHSEF